jgi:hypothetical protein
MVFSTVQPKRSPEEFFNKICQELTWSINAAKGKQQLIAQSAHAHFDVIAISHPAWPIHDLKPNSASKTLRDD